MSRPSRFAGMGGILSASRRAQVFGGGEGSEQETEAPAVGVKTDGAADTPVETAGSAQAPAPPAAASNTARRGATRSAAGTDGRAPGGEAASTTPASDAPASRRAKATVAGDGAGKGGRRGGGAGAPGEDGRADARGPATGERRSAADADGDRPAGGGAGAPAGGRAPARGSAVPHAADPIPQPAHDRASDAAAVAPPPASDVQVTPEVRHAKPSDGKRIPASAADATAGLGSGVSFTPTGRTIEARPLDAIRPSPFQPAGRPSREAVAAVAAAIREAGSLEALVGTEGAPTFARLDQEAARLAELAFDISVHGVKDPIETRLNEAGEEECLSGHRRMAAARLAGLAAVPVLARGALSNAHAAATVLSGNLHRESFTPWQEAVLVSEVKLRRAAESLPSDVRSLCRVMGWSGGKVQGRLKLRRMLSDDLLESLGAEDAWSRLNRVGSNDLGRIADTPDPARRAELLRRALGLPLDARRVAPAPSAVPFTRRPRRGGGLVLEIRQEIESMAAGDLALVREELENQLARVRARQERLRQGG